MLKSTLDFVKRDGSCVTTENDQLTLIAGTDGMWVLACEALEDLAEGSEIHLKIYNFQMSHRWQTDFPRRRDYVTCQYGGDAQYAFQAQNYRREPVFKIVSGTVRKGEKIILRFGDFRQGGAGSEVFWSTSQGRIETTLKNTCGECLTVIDSKVNIVHDSKVARMRLLGPSVASIDETFTMNLVFFDRNCNVIEDFCSTVEFEAPEHLEGVPERIAVSENNNGIIKLKNVRLKRPGVFRVVARLPQYSLSIESNPMICEENPKQKIFWGDMHSHGWGDDSMLLMHDRTKKVDPAQRHEQSINVGRFDYYAPGAMCIPDDKQQRQKIWQAYAEAFEKYDRPGEYVPFMAMEMHPGTEYGDRTIVFRAEHRLPDLNSLGCPADELYRRYDSSECLIETHIGGSVPFYDKYKPGREDLVEICSAFGNAEWLLQQNLREGFHSAVTGASDLHVGLSGAPRAVETFRGRFGYKIKMNVRDCGYGSGPVGAVLAPELERESLWQSLLKRNSYATSGDRIYLSLDAGGFTMGDIANLPDKFMVNLTVHAQSEIEKISLIVGKFLAREWHPDTKDKTIEFEFDRNTMPPGKWFYFRIRQHDSEYAWTAPVWFADEQFKGGGTTDFLPWNHTEKPVVCTNDDQLNHYLGELEKYLETEGERDNFGDIEAVGIFDLSMGRCARFISSFTQNGRAITILWFFEFEIPKIRLDWGYEDFGVINCQTGESIT